MAPKSLSPAQKQAQILKRFHDTNAPVANTALEHFMKQVSAEAGISVMRDDQYRELLTNLVDEGQVRMEKIGSGNWYWSFVSEAKKSKEKILHDLETEHHMLHTVIAEIEAQVISETTARADSDDTILGGAVDRRTLLEMHDRLLNETTALEKELAGYSASDPMEILRKEEETKTLKESAEKWTDYIEGCESLMMELTNRDRKQVADIMAQTCGDEYVTGEGLKDL